MLCQLIFRLVALASAKEFRHLKLDLAPGLYASPYQEAHPDLYLVALNFSWPWTFSTLSADPISAMQTFLPDLFPTTGRDASVSCVPWTNQNPSASRVSYTESTSGFPYVHTGCSPLLRHNLGHIRMKLLNTGLYGLC